MRTEENNLPELPESWVWAKLEEVAETASGGTPTRKEPKYFGGLIPWLKSGELNDCYIVSAEETITEEGLKNSSAKIFPKGSLLVALYGATAGKTGILGIDAATNQAICAIKPVESSFLAEFIQYFLIYLRKDLLQNRYGGAQPNLSQILLKNLLIPIAPLTEQHRIFAKIEEIFTELDAGVEALKKLKEQLKLYRQAVLKAAVEGKLTKEWQEAHKEELEPASVLLERIKEERRKNAKGKYKELAPIETEDLPELPEQWIWTRISEVSNKIHYGYTASATDEPIGPKMLRITDIQNNSVNWENVPYCEIGPEKKKNYLLKEGDLVFARTGATVGKSFLIRGNIPEAVFASYLIRIILSDSLKKDYIYYFFQSYFYWQQIYGEKIGIGQPNVNATKLSKLLIPLPPKLEQNKIVEEIERRLSVADDTEKTVEQSFKQAESLRQSILKRAFEGKLVPQDPTDEPAERLLERIREKKAKRETERNRKRRLKGKMTLDDWV